MIRINYLNCVCYDKKMETPVCWSELYNGYSYGTK